MTPDLVLALDDCLARLRRGEALDSVLVDYPERAPELASLTRVAAVFNSLRETVPPDPATVAAGRQRFLAEAARLRQTQAARAARPTPIQRLRDWLAGLSPRWPVALRWATTFVMAVILFALVSGGAVVAANDSLPGDPLYPVKRAAEAIQLTLTFNDAAREKMLLQYQARRQAEVNAVVSADREVGVAFEGTISQVAPDSVTVTGFPPVLLDANTVVSGTLEVGARVQVAALVKDGALHAERITVVVPPPTATPTPSATMTQTAAPSATSTPQPSATWTVMPTVTGTSKPSLPVETQPPPSPTRTPTPTRTLTVALTATASLTPTVAPTASPVPTRLQKYRFEGWVEAIAGEVWTVAGQQVVITNSTEFDESQGKAEVGALVSVVAERQPDGHLDALKITVKQARPVEFSGPIDEIGQGYWIVGGRRVTVNTDTKIEGQPEIGATARVEAIRLADDSLVAVHIVVEPAQTIQFTAPIVSIGPATWVVGSWTVYLDANTAIDGEPSVGAIAEVTARVRTDGSLLATQIRIRPRPTLTVSPTSVPSATPTLQPSATPTVTVASTSTATPTAEPEMTSTPTPTTEQPTGTPGKGGTGATGTPTPGNVEQPMMTPTAGG